MNQNYELIIYKKNFYVILKKSSSKRNELIKIFIILFLILIFFLIVLIIIIEQFKINDEDYHVCGISPTISSRVNKRIINGDDVKLNSFPWIVSIRILRGNKFLSKHGLQFVFFI
jgi:hypothetical protein